MTNPDLLLKLAEIIVDVLDVDGLSPADITAETTAEMIEGWDSLQHVRILTSIERQFGFRFANDEIFDLANVGALAARVAARIG